VLFSLPEDNVADIARQMRTHPLPVSAYDRDNKTMLASGRLESVNNEIDPTTGTVRLKAIFSNTDRALWPNQFVNAWLLLRTERGATVAPAAAVQRGAQGNYVFVVKPDSTVEMRPVAVDLTVGDWITVSRGLAVGERVVTDGQDRLQAGMKVQVRQGGTPAPSNRNATGAAGGASE
jgi:multidrug efflux system membrane fusion protein